MLSDGLFNARPLLVKVLMLAGRLAQNNNYFTNCSAARLLSALHQWYTARMLIQK